MKNLFEIENTGSTSDTLESALASIAPFELWINEKLILGTKSEGLAEQISWKNCKLYTNSELSFETKSMFEYLIKQYVLENDLELAEAKLDLRTTLTSLDFADYTISSLLKKICAEAAYRFSSNMVIALTIKDEEQMALEISGYFGLSSKNLNNVVLASNSLLEQVVSLNTSLSIPDTKNLKLSSLSVLCSQRCAALNVLPLSLNEKALGVVIVGYPTKEFYDNAHKELLAEFASSASLSLHNALTQLTLSDYTERLEELVAVRTNELAKQTDKAEEANRAKNRFIANMSHELRTPLTAITGYASVLSSGVLGQVSQKQVDSLENIIKASQHLKELIDEVLNLAKIEAGKDQAEPSKIEVKSLVKQVYKLMLQSALGKNIELTLNFDELSDKTLHTFFDPRHIRQALVNLTSNAIKYTKPEGHVEIKLSAFADKVRVTVTDDGVGISDEHQKRLFKRFERSDDDYSNSQTGTGIGLALTKHLIELGGGTIGMKSEQGVGSTFWADLPSIEVTELVISDERSKPFDERLDGLSILVIDDNKQTCELLKMLLSEKGGEVTSSCTVAEAKALYERLDFDILLVDLAIPGESGIDFISHIREKNSIIPIVVVSACVFEMDRMNAEDSGANAFIAKPFSTEEIVHVVRQKVTDSALKTSRGDEEHA